MPHVIRIPDVEVSKVPTRFSHSLIVCILAFPFLNAKICTMSNAKALSAFFLNFVSLFQAS